MFRDLSLRSGLFPFCPRDLRAPRLTAMLFTNWYSEFGKSGEPKPYSDYPVLYPQWEHITLYLNIFRREPAITRFDWLFTPYHKSSPRVARRVGSGLHLCFHKLHPAHGKLTWFRVVCMILLFRAINTRFPYGSTRSGLNQQHTYTRWLILQ